MPIDYSKWKTIEVSDDEDDTHPNIDTPSLFRWPRQEGICSKVQEIEDKLKSTELDEKERIKLQLEKQTIQQQEEEYKKKELELEEKERQQPWNVDTIGREAWSKSIINKAGEKKVTEVKEDEDEAYKKVLKFFEDNDSLLRELSLLDGFEKLENYLLDHPHLSSESTTNFLTIEALNLAIEKKCNLVFQMDRVAENCITLQYLLELAKSLNAVATNTNIIKNFFKKISMADPSYMKMYKEEVDAFKGRLRKRAQDKRDAAVNELEATAKAKRIAESPGGLDPQEVLDSLPEEMQDAFQTQSMDKMFEVAENMDPEVFQHHLQRCIASGLWVPNAAEAAEKKAREEADIAKGREIKSDI
uniref:Hsp90 chaperone protein kinase-targeting subunit n=1 Tax=Ditylenchus dipsaci TaxID=166011 RepID=A0A915DRN1_9BILA